MAGRLARDPAAGAFFLTGYLDESTGGKMGASGEGDDSELAENLAEAPAAVAEGTEVGLVVSVAIGLTLSTLSTPLYRILEGYSGWPAGWPEKRIAHHREQRKSLHDQVTETRREPSGSAVMDALALEKFSRYPDNDAQVAPTMLGNAIRRFEYYAFDRYQLDSQLCWYHLRAVAPGSPTRTKPR